MISQVAVSSSYRRLGNKCLTSHKTATTTKKAVENSECVVKTSWHVNYMLPQFKGANHVP